MTNWTRIVRRTLHRTNSSLDLLGLEADLLRREGRLALRTIRAQEASLLSARRRLRDASRAKDVSAGTGARMPIPER